MRIIYSTLLFICMYGISCGPASHEGPIKTDALPQAVDNRLVSDTSFVFLDELSDGFLFEMKYATEDNFIKKKVYSCDKCLIRKEVAQALVNVNNTLAERGLKIKFYDCYRPLSVQQQMWEIYPDARYVANPNTTGSIHNRGGAVDITLANHLGEDLDMGTGFDYFGEEAHHDYMALPDTVLANRNLLKAVMGQHGFDPIKTEWWHYNFRKAKDYDLSDFSTDCE